MDRKEIINMIKNRKKQTFVKAFIQSNVELEFKGSKQFGDKNLYLVIGDYSSIYKIIEENKDHIKGYYIDIISRNSNIPLLDYSKINARIEPGAIIREGVEIENDAIILMGAIVNIGAHIGRKSMIDMNAIIGSNAFIGNNVHVGAGAVISGVLEPPSSKKTTIEDNVFIGANAVILEGIRIKENSIIGAGAVVTKDVPSNSLVVGVPGKVVRKIDNNLIDKTKNEEDLR